MEVQSFRNYAGRSNEQIRNLNEQLTEFYGFEIFKADSTDKTKLYQDKFVLSFCGDNVY